MQIREKSGSRLAEFDELFPLHPQPLVPKKAADYLQSHIISGFETALDQGMPPLDALSTILGWVSSEIARVKLDAAGSSARER